MFLALHNIFETVFITCRSTQSYRFHSLTITHLFPSFNDEYLLNQIILLNSNRNRNVEHLNGTAAWVMCRVFTYQILRPKRLTSETGDAVARQDTSALTADLFGPHDSHDENPPQGQKYLETRIRQTHYRVTNRPRNIAFVPV